MQFRWDNPVYFGFYLVFLNVHVYNYMEMQNISKYVLFGIYFRKSK